MLGCMIDISDITGKNIQKSEIKQVNLNMNIQNLNSGIYFIRISKNNECIHSQKIIKN